MTIQRGSRQSDAEAFAGDSEDSSTGAHGAYPDVVVSVGTDHHPFDRLVAWVDEWCDGHPEVEIIIQRGRSQQSRHGLCRELIPYAQLCEMFAEAAVVISHGGPATVMEALSAGRLPIVVARDPAFGEHVDGHQLRFAEHLQQNGLANVVTTKQDLFEAIDRSLANPDSHAVTVKPGISDGVARFADVVNDILGPPAPRSNS